MIVRCANCHTEFSLDDQQIGPEGATVRCSVCSYVFAVEPPPGAGDHPWQIRTVEDLLFTAPDLATLRTWIAEGRLHPDDQVSRTGKHWLRLGDMPEFSSAFSGFSNLPQVFEPLEPPPSGSALEELGPPPGFGETMPVIQGVDTGILDLGRSSDYEVPVTARTPAVERSLDLGRLPPPPPPPPLESLGSGETSGPEPFPLAELPVVDDDDDGGRPRGIDESALRMRPRPYTPTQRVPALLFSAVPEVVDDEPVEEVRRRPSRPTVRYGADEVHGAASMLDAVTHVVDDSDDGAEVRPTAAAVERAPVAPREPSGKRRAAVPPSPLSPSQQSGARPAPPAIERDPSSEELPVARSRRATRDSESFDDEPAEPRRRSRAAARELDEPDEPPRRRSAWPLVAGLGVLAGVAVVFGVPSIRAKVLGLAGDVAGREPFDPASLAELEQAQAAMASLDPKVLGEAEAALQARLDAGKVPPEGVAEMQLAQAELLATRALDHAIGRAVGAPPPAGPTDDVERATQILGALVAEHVVDRDHMRRVRALVRLAQGRPAAEILPLLPEDGSGEQRRLVEAAPLWRDPVAPMPEGVVAGLEGLPERSTLAQLALALAYLRAGDETKAQQVVDAVLGRVPTQPTALALRARAGGASVASPEGKAPAEGKAPEGKAPEGKAPEGKAPAEGKAADEGAGKPDGGSKPARAESIDSLIDRGCRLAESGSADEGLDLLRKAKVRRAKDPDILVCIGKGLARQGRHRDALDSYKDALRINPRFAEALESAAKAADKLGETDKAKEYYRRLLEVRHRDAKALAYIEAHGG